MVFGQLRASISVVRSSSYTGSDSRVLTDPTGERRKRQFRQRFRGLQSCRPNSFEESGLKAWRRSSILFRTVLDRDRIRQRSAIDHHRRLILSRQQAGSAYCFFPVSEAHGLTRWTPLNNRRYRFQPNRLAAKPFVNAESHSALRRS